RRLVCGGPPPYVRHSSRPRASDDYRPVGTGPPLVVEECAGHPARRTPWRAPGGSQLRADQRRLQGRVLLSGIDGRAGTVSGCPRQTGAALASHGCAGLCAGPDGRAPDGGHARHGPVAPPPVSRRPRARARSRLPGEIGTAVVMPPALVEAIGRITGRDWFARADPDWIPD